MTSPQWIDLDGAANVRDLAGLPTVDDKVVQPHRLIRSDNLQGLTEHDVRRLVDELGVRAVVDLRTGVEVGSEGPGPLHHDPRVDVHHLSLFPESGTTTDATTAEDGPVVLPWQDRDFADSDDPLRQGAAAVYLSYLDQRPDSVLEALRTIAYSGGATVVHCAAGKDRTGVVVAFALSEVGVTREAIVADYALTAERIDAVLERLRSSHTYAHDIVPAHDVEGVAKHTPRPVTMERLLGAVDAAHGGVPAWLRENGWTDEDARALRQALLGESGAGS